MNKREKRKAINEFIDRWTDRGDEKQDAQSFWVDLLQSVLEIPNATKVIRFEDAIKLGKKHHGFIDGYIPSTKVLIEQKGYDIDLDKPQKQSDGQILTPYEQAKRYADQLGYDDRPRWIVVSNFRELRIHDMNKPQDDPEVILLQLLDKEAYRLEFLVDREKVLEQRELEVSLQAGELVGKLYDALEKQFEQPVSAQDYVSLNKLCVRLVFCLYAEDAGLFGDNQFHTYLKEQSKLGIPRLNSALKALFKTLNTKESDRDPDDDPSLLAFPYVNGGLFADDTSRIPRFSEEVFDLLVNQASSGFDWSEISPTIFGAVFESTLNKETRRQGGMHYTSITNIHKVIDPLFLDDLKDEFAALKKKVENSSRVTAGQAKEIQAFQKKIASLTFLDPACGSGNFLTETYLSLRRIENEVLDLLYGGQQSFSEVSPIQVKIDHFYGIEINDFAVVVAKTALWIAESQMMRATEDIVQQDLNFLPLKAAAHIVEGNALRMDWADVVRPEDLSYIIGNPPFSGARFMTKANKADLMSVFGEDWLNVGDLDFVCAWFKIAAQLMQGTSIRAGLVATNSICQGTHVSNLWEGLVTRYGVRINFAHRTFVWDSEATDKAHVYCVIIGFSSQKIDPVRVFDDGTEKQVRHLNAYLVEGEDVFVHSRSVPLWDVPKIGIGNKPIDGGHYLFNEETMAEFLRREPQARRLFHPWVGSDEFIKGKKRWVLWLGDLTAEELMKLPECLKRRDAVKQYRLNSPSAGTVKLAQKPTRFHVENMPTSNFLVIPKVSSEKRRYVPMGLCDPNTFCSDLVFMVPQTTLFHFGVLTSVVHMAWMRAVAGRLESRYRYSKDIVYNCFPWPNPKEHQKKKIEQTAQAILDARAAHPTVSMAQLYGEHSDLFEDLVAAHEANDKAVMAAYGFKSTMTEPEIVAKLFELYQARTDEIAAEEQRKAEEAAAAKTKPRARKKKGS